MDQRSVLSLESDKTQSDTKHIPDLNILTAGRINRLFRWALKYYLLVFDTFIVLPIGH